MKISFHRKYEFQARIVNTIRAFSLNLGYEAPVDPLSGMSVSLPEMDNFTQQVLFQIIELKISFGDVEQLCTYLKEKLQIFGAMNSLIVEPNPWSEGKHRYQWNKTSDSFKKYDQFSVQAKVMGNMTAMLLIYDISSKLVTIEGLKPDFVFDLDQWIIQDQTVDHAKESSLLKVSGSDQFDLCFCDPIKKINYMFISKSSA